MCDDDLEFSKEEKRDSCIWIEEDLFEKVDANLEILPQEISG